ncbi:MAG: hypothetical protein FJ398_08790 [Verrucomicrobia bacterium]|nr:hypothetical protein [Verrucomicrobiota bacterium]
MNRSLRTVAFRPLQRWTPESARKQPEGCGPHGFRFKGHVHGAAAMAASHEPRSTRFHCVPDFTQRSKAQFQGRGGTRPLPVSWAVRTVEASKTRTRPRSLLSVQSATRAGYSAFAQVISNCRI